MAGGVVADGVVVGGVVTGGRDVGGVVAGAVVTGGAGVVGDAEKVAELQAFAKQRIAPYKYPRSIEFAAELPRTSTGKVQRYRLREPQHTA